eukprot:gene834-33565_t
MEWVEERTACGWGALLVDEVGLPSGFIIISPGSKTFLCVVGTAELLAFNSTGAIRQLSTFQCPMSARVRPTFDSTAVNPASDSSARFYPSFYTRLRPGVFFFSAIIEGPDAKPPQLPAPTPDQTLHLTPYAPVRVRQPVPSAYQTPYQTPRTAYMLYPLLELEAAFTAPAPRELPSITTASARGPGWVNRAAIEMLHERLFNDQKLENEYRSIIEHDRLLGHTVDDSQEPDSLPLNRYDNVLPYDYNRVKLESHANDYINASVVQYCEPGINGLRFSYIAMQGPLQNTVEDVWRLILEQGVESVVMLTNPEERGITKCSPYIPENQGDQVFHDGEETHAGGLIISNSHVRRSPDGDLTVRKMEVQSSADPDKETDARGSGNPDKETGLQSGVEADKEAPNISTRPRTSLVHYQYHSWPDHGTPEDSTTIMSIAEALHRKRDEHCWADASSLGGNGEASESQSSASRPVVVHCSAGIGRTGTFIVLDIMRQRLRNLAELDASGSKSVSKQDIAEVLDLPALVCELRLQRMGMVQTYEQYIFCYQATYEDCQRLIARNESVSTTEHERTTSEYSTDGSEFSGSSSAARAASRT